MSLIAISNGIAIGCMHLALISGRFILGSFSELFALEYTILYIHIETIHM